MKYETFAPAEALSALVKCYWNLESSPDETQQKQTIVPDGCPEMIFHYGDLYKQYLENGDGIIQPRCFVMGQLTKPLQIEPTGRTGIFSVRFHPGGFMPFATVPIKEMENKAVALEQLFKHEGTKLEQNILNAATTPDRVSFVEKLLIAKLANEDVVSRIVKSAVKTIVTANGQIQVDELSKQVHVDRRQLERKFSSGIGLTPKQLSKIIRLQATLKMLLNKQFTSLTALSYEGAYYDQAHFIKDFKELTGLTPKEFYGNSLQMSSLFYRT